jgi:2-polyprenyl-3-methyl-5-hydroxy-6-metoxy-1,4-benzoquinol methylase
VLECRGWVGRLEPGANPFGASGRERLLLTDRQGIGYWHDPVSDIVYASPRFTRESLREQYQRAGAHIDTRTYAGFDRGAWERSGDRSYHVSRLKLELVKGRLGPTAAAQQDAGHKARILDVGCHVGLFVMLAQEAGFDCCGIDVSADAICAGTAHLGLRGLRAATLQEAGFEDASFDGVVAWDVLEHVPDLMDLMAHCARVLRPGGWFFAQVPNHRGVTARLKTLASRAGLRGGRYHHFGFPWHLYHFSPRSLDLLVRRAGMEPVQIASFSHRTKDGRPPRGALAWVNRGLERLSLSDYLYVVARRSAAGAPAPPDR